MTTPQDLFPRQPGGAATRLILSASAASDPERLKRMIERWRGGAGGLSGLGPRSLEPLQLTGLPAVAADIDLLGRAIERVRGRLGCPHCCSGFDLDFQRELEALALTTEREPGGSAP